MIRFAQRLSAQFQKQAGLPATLLKCMPSDDVNDRPRSYVHNDI